MNSLSELNAYASTSITYPDERPASVTFNPLVLANQSMEGYENQLLPLTIPAVITSIINRPQDLTISINLSNSVSGTTLTWDNTFPTMTQSVVGRVYTIGGIQTPSQFDLAKVFTIHHSTITEPQNFTFDTTVNYGLGTYAYATSITILHLEQLTAASDFTYLNDIPQIITGTPQVYDLNVYGVTNNAFTLVVSSHIPSGISSMSSAGSIGGTSSFNATTKELTITGDLAQVNSHLSSITLTPTIDSEVTMIFTYALFNLSNDFWTRRTQMIRATNALYLSKPASLSFYYNENLEASVTTPPQITNDLANVSTTYLMTIGSSEVGAIDTLSDGDTFNSTFNNTTKVLTLTGTKSTINTNLNNLVIRPALDYRNTITLNYTLAISGTTVAGRTQLGYVSALDTNISNMSVTREFISNTADQTIFATNTPQIVETITGATYTIYLSSVAGKFNTSSTSVPATFSYSGTKSEVNALFSTIKFYPNKNVVGTQTFTYQQYRNGVLQDTVTGSLNGTARVTAIPGQTEHVFLSTYSYTPTFEQANYLLADILMVGGGGAGSSRSADFYSANYGQASNSTTQALTSSGGAGGVVRTFTNKTLGSSTTITVGVGGSSLANNGTTTGNGTASSITGIGSAGGGYSGAIGYWSGSGTSTIQYGRVGGANSDYVGGQGVTNLITSNYRGGGGGAGAGGIGGNADATGATPKSGAGGAPAVVTFNSKIYTVGHGGQGISFGGAPTDLYQAHVPGFNYLRGGQNLLCLAPGDPWPPVGYNPAYTYTLINWPLTNDSLMPGPYYAFYKDTYGFGGSAIMTVGQGSPGTSGLVVIKFHT
jgi:hypothetical protein